MRLFLVLLTIFGLTYSSSSQLKLRYDSGYVNQRSFSPEEMEKYKSDADFQYERIMHPRKSLWDQFWEWFWDKVGELFSTEPGKRGSSILLLLVATGILVFGILKLTGMTNVGLFGTNKSDPMDYAVAEENIHTISFEDAIEEAVGQGNYRLAVRLLYLQTLKILSDRHLINWQIDKTDVTYIKELHGSVYERKFSDLTLQFENNWYGDVPVLPEQFPLIRESFRSFNKELE
jgi:hypothetical protein